MGNFIPQITGKSWWNNNVFFNIFTFLFQCKCTRSWVHTVLTQHLLPNHGWNNSPSYIYITVQRVAHCHPYLIWFSWPTCHWIHFSWWSISACPDVAAAVLAVVLIHWGWNKMAAILQMTFSNAFSSIKMYEFHLIFHWCLFIGVQLTVFQQWFR